MSTGPLTPRLFEDALQQLLPEGGPVLLAASGGCDSTCCAHLLKAIGYPFAVGHVNYRLRGAESDEDEAFVRELAGTLGVRAWIYRCSDVERDDLMHSATQEKARELRYDILHGWRSSGNFSALVTAHQADDQAETLVHRFIRGCGVEGLGGIPPSVGSCIRPLLAFSRQSIEAWGRSQGLVWRMDSTNATLQYTRNRIRLRLLPEALQVNPGLTGTLASMAVIYRETAVLVERAVSELVRESCVPEGEHLRIPVEWLFASGCPHLILWHILGPHGFTPGQAQEAFLLAKRRVGASLRGPRHALWRDRLDLVLSPDHIGSPAFGEIHAEDRLFEGPIRLGLQVVPRESWDLDRSPDTAQLDFDRLRFPLTVRQWKEGDRIRPLGMTGTRLVSDVLTGKKIGPHLRGRTAVITSGGAVCCIPGIMVSEDFRVNDATRQVWVARLLKP